MTSVPIFLACSCLVVLNLVFLGIVIERVSRLLTKPKPIEYLKNALLSYALMKCGEKDDSRLDYKSFDGSTLPNFAGINTSNACFSYVVSHYDRFFGPWSSKIMNDKSDAIDKYIVKNLSTDGQIVEFFERFTTTSSSSVKIGDCVEKEKTL